MEGGLENWGWGGIKNGHYGDAVFIYEYTTIPLQFREGESYEALPPTHLCKGR